MFIQKKRIRNITPYISHLKDGENIIFGLSDIFKFKNTLNQLGFLDPIKSGQIILPSVVGPITRYNSRGKEVIHKDLPMETAYRQTDWKWKEWDGSWHSKIVDVPYKRYPRSFVAPPSVELLISNNKKGNLVLISPVYQKREEYLEIITHVVNIFLELFGECELFTDSLDTIVITPIHRLNWTILPQGELPWQQLKQVIDPIVREAPIGNQKLLYYRLETVNSFKPDFRAIGKGGFHGYIIHGFTKNKIYVLESMYYGNATYILGETWEEISKMTKSEIINENLHKARIIHRIGWKKKIGELINLND